jgi:hypothetical protein
MNNHSEIGLTCNLRFSDDPSAGGGAEGPQKFLSPAPNDGPPLLLLHSLLGKSVLDEIADQRLEAG